MTLETGGAWYTSGMASNLAQRLAGVAPALRETPLLGRALRRARASADRALVAAGRPPLSTELAGRRLTGYLRHRAFLDQLTKGEYEAFALELFLERVGPGTTVVDGGAHIGFYSVMASPRTGPGGSVLAFEADPYNFRALSANVRLNRLANVALIDKALADHVGRLSFFTSSGTIAGSLVDKRYIGETTAVSVEATTIDDELSYEGHENLIMKLDVEGAEERALRGAERTLRACRTGAVLVEHNPQALRDAGSSDSAVVELLHEYGFSPSFVDERRRALVPLGIGEVPPRKGNLIADKG